VQVVEQLCAVLQEAHGHIDEKTGAPKPIIHRDLKPSNLMLIDSKHQQEVIRLKVLDFGIAKMIEDEGSTTEQTVTAAGDMLGTPAYMSPEQIKGGFDKEEKSTIDGRSDLYSTGVVIYHLLTGVRPFRGNSMAMIGAHLNLPPPSMKESNPDAKVPPEVERVVLQCLEKDPAKRPQSARELSEKFLRAAGQTPRQTSTGPIPGPPLPVKKIAAGLAAVAATIIVAAFAYRSMVPSKTGPIADVVKKELDPPKPPKPPVVEPWIPAGYVAASEERAKDTPDEFLKLKRTDDGVVFIRSEKPGIYIPDGYTAAFSDSTNPNVVTRLERTVGRAKFDRTSRGIYLPIGYQEVAGDGIPPWPRTLIRSRDKVKFIRITGGVYQRGDPGEDLALDSEDAPCTPHHVRVPGFYIQETEVTNGEIEDYIKLDPDRKKGLTSWDQLFTTIRGDDTKADKVRARRFPAAHIDFWTARKYAASVQGVLPTEAEWEYAARSRNQSNIYSYGKEPTLRDEPLKANLASPAQNPGDIQSVDDFPDDATDQHVRGMTGGVQELCADVYKPYSQLDLTRYSSGDPLVDRRDDALPKSDDFKVVVKGGSFFLLQTKAKAFLRYTIRANESLDSIGFRVAIECPPEVWPSRSPGSDSR
jgi:eukaryotic-like serine/threonine-protein kinase